MLDNAINDIIAHPKRIQLKPGPFCLESVLDLEIGDRLCICCTSHRLDECGTRAFSGGAGRRVVAQTRPAALKSPRTPSAFPKKGRLKHQVLKLAPPSLGRWSPEGTLDRIRVPANTADRSVVVCRVGICRTSHRPDECGTRPF